MESIYSQTYTVNFLISYDNVAAKGYIPKVAACFEVTPDKTHSHFYNLYLNKLKANVTDGFFCVIDDDDFLPSPKAIERIIPHLSENELLICQFTRNGRVKPPNRQMDERKIEKGYIGMPCFFLHHSKKDLADFSGDEDADYTFIKTVSEKLKTKFVMIPVVESPNRNRGRME